MSEKIKFVFKDEKIVFKFREVINLGGGSGATDDTKKVLISANDTIEGYLSDKIVAGSGVSIQTVNSGGNEQLEISVSNSSSALGKLLASYTFTGGERYILFDNLNINKDFSQAYYKLIISASSESSPIAAKIRSINGELSSSLNSDYRYIMSSEGSLYTSGTDYCYFGAIYGDSGKGLIDFEFYLFDGILQGFSRSITGKETRNGRLIIYAVSFRESSLPQLNSFEVDLSYTGVNPGGCIYLYEIPLR